MVEEQNVLPHVKLRKINYVLQNLLKRGSDPDVIFSSFFFSVLRIRRARVFHNTLEAFQEEL